MVAPIFWFIGWALVASCGAASREETDAGPQSSRRKKPGPDAGPQPPTLERSEYQPADPFILPQATREGLFYRRFAADFANPLALECDPKENRCSFAAGHQYFSFPADEETLSNSDPIPLTPLADFAPEVDGAATHFVDILAEGSHIYALYDGATPGIAIRTLEGEALTPFSFDALRPRPVTCPTDLLSFNEQIWLSAANCSTTGYNNGAVVSLNIEEEGLLSASGQDSFVTTQKIPSQLAAWQMPVGEEFNNGVGELIASVNRGEDGRSGIDFFNPSQKTTEAVANIPLGDVSANQMLITTDQLVALLGSGARHWLLVNDMLWSANHITNSDGLAEAPLADADNPVRLFPPDSPFETGAVHSLAYDGQNQKILASTSNGKILQLRGKYQTVSQGIALLTGFGYIEGHYFCNDGETEGCGPVDFLEHGAIALTQNPASVTYLPNALFVD